MRGPATLTRPFAYPFRIFFLSAALWAMLAVVLWVAQLNGHAAIDPAWPVLRWHRHELLFGLLQPALAGFLLTAVCVWTSTERLHGWRLVLLWAVWLGGRIAAGWGGAESALLATLVTLLFLPLVALDAGWRIVRAQQWRQLPLLLVLLLLWASEAGMLLTGESLYTDAALLLVAALMLLVGGRITPAFTANWLRGRGADPAAARTSALLDYLLAGALAVLLAQIVLQLPYSATTALAAATLSLFRLVMWRGWLAAAEPLLWVLHLSLLWIPLALALFAGAQWWGWPGTAWQHALGIGAMGSLILGVMARVSLGHTGRPLKLPGGMVSGFVLLQAAALLRVVTVFGLVPWRWGIAATSLAWLLAFLIFCVRYAPVLCAPRIDGRPG